MKTFLTALLFGPIAMILIPSIELVTIMANYKKTMLILISVFFTASHSFMARAEDQEPSSSINCTIKAYRPTLCGVRCDDIIQKGPFEITYQSNGPKITIFQGEIEGKPVKSAISGPTQRVYRVYAQKHHG